MKFVSWNVNGLRACLNKGFSDFFRTTDADAFCLQEIKMQEGQLEFEPEGYHSYWNYAEKKGYSGTAIFSKNKATQVEYQVGLPEFDTEGRIVTLEFDDYYLVNIYAPNSQKELARLSQRMVWEDRFKDYVKDLDKHKSVIFCGDLNVAHQEIDLKNPKSNKRNAGFTDEEREKFTALLEAGFVDSYRHFYPEVEGAYTWWSYMFNARKNNAGWRIDYFCTSKNFAKRLLDAQIHPDIHGSDHCPVSLIFN